MHFGKASPSLRYACGPKKLGAAFTFLREHVTCEKCIAKMPAPENFDESMRELRMNHLNNAWYVYRSH